MDLPTLITAIIGISVAAGAVTAFYKRSEGTNTIDLLKTNVMSYEISEKQHLAQIALLESRVKDMDKALAESRSTLKTVIKEFKEYKDGN